MSIHTSGGMSSPSKKRKLDVFASGGGHEDVDSDEDLATSSPEERDVSPPSVKASNSQNGVKTSAQTPRSKKNGLHTVADPESESAMLSSRGSGHSAMLMLQVNELLSEVRPNYEKQIGLLQDTLQQAKKIIESLP